MASAKSGMSPAASASRSARRAWAARPVQARPWPAGETDVDLELRDACRLRSPVGGSPLREGRSPWGSSGRTRSATRACARALSAGSVASARTSSAKAVARTMSPARSWCSASQPTLQIEASVLDRGASDRPLLEPTALRRRLCLALSPPRSCRRAARPPSRSVDASAAWSVCSSGSMTRSDSHRWTAARCTGVARGVNWPMRTAGERTGSGCQPPRRRGRPGSAGSRIAGSDQLRRRPGQAGDSEPALLESAGAIARPDRTRASRRSPARDLHREVARRRIGSRVPSPGRRSHFPPEAASIRVRA